MNFLNFFGLKEDPFRLTPDPAYFYPSTSHNEGLMLMDYSIEQKEGFLLIIGDPGTGKTTLLKVFLEKWKSRAEIAMILTPRLSPEEFLISVAEDLKINLGNKNKNEIIKALMDFMTEKFSEDKRVIIIVDEAQNLPDETLEELRLLSNIETDKDKLIQIILLGQVELESKLGKDKLRQLNQRITTRIHLQHFNLRETQDYINYRAIKAGKKNLQIDRRADKLVYKLSNGIPRLINMLISRALMAAYLEEQNIILPRHVYHAMKSLNHSDIKIRRLNKLMPAFASIFLVFLVISASAYFYLWNNDSNIVVKPVMRAESIQKQSETIAPKNEDNFTNIDLTDIKLVSVKVFVANIRERPSLYSAKVGHTLKDNQFVVLQEVTDNQNMKWYQVPFHGEKRWISEWVVKEVKLKEMVEKGADSTIIKKTSELTLNETPDL